MRELLEETVGHFHGGVRCVEREVTEERTIFVLLDELHRVVRQVVRDIAFAADQLAVVIELRVEILSPVSGSKTVVFIETAGVRMIGKLRPVMPLAESAGGGSSTMATTAAVTWASVAPPRRTILFELDNSRTPAS